MKIRYLFLMIVMLVFTIVHSIPQETKILKEKIAQKEDEIRQLVLQQPGAKKLFEEYNDTMSKVILKDAFTPEIKKLMKRMSQLLEKKCIIYESADYKKLTEDAEKYRSTDPEKFDKLWDKKENLFANIDQQLEKDNNELIRLTTQLKIDPWSSLGRAEEPEIHDQLTRANEQFKALIVPLKPQLDNLLAELNTLSEDLKDKQSFCEERLEQQKHEIMMGHDFDAIKQIPVMVAIGSL